MDLHRHLRSLTLLVFILATYFSTVLARHHRIRHQHQRHKRQHPTSYLTDNFVVDGDGGPESGDWGPWSQASECSRSCGGGVAYQTRTCGSVRSDGSEYCTGGYKRHFSCNIQDCPGGATDFRAEQCAEFNNIPFESRNYEWVPYTKATNRCELNCMPRGERFYYRHKRKVTDGTRCEEEKLDVCVDGRCLPVGCDNILGSTAREDLCRECGGDGSSCNTVQGNLQDNDLQVGYNDILLIPAGATNIHVFEVDKSNNYLAIRNETGHYYLNGNWRIDFPRSLKFVGTTFHYQRQPHGFYSPDNIAALGPTTEAIFIVLLYQEKNPGVQYQYSIPKGVAIHTDIDHYAWLPGEFSECSTSCGDGEKTRSVQCVSRKDRERVDDSLCDPGMQPRTQETCRNAPCPARWSVSGWGPCSTTCGEAGIRLRQVNCVKVDNNMAVIAADDECVQLLGAKPEVQEACNEDVVAVCPQWHVGPWKPCDHLCGDGLQRRKVRCYVRDGDNITVVDDSDCGEKPEDSKPCMMRPCEGVDWVTSEWSGCEDKCSLTQETRKAFCANKAGKVYPDSRCHKNRLPELERNCSSPVQCEFQWYAAQWSKCSASCGNGVQTRKVFCGSVDEESIKKVEDEKCDAEEKYETTMNCTAQTECTGQWYSGPWSSCSKECGGGEMSRKVICLLDNVTVDYKNCDASLTVFSSESCNNDECGPDQILPMEPEKTTVSDDDDCEEDEDGSDADDVTIITMETTPIGLEDTGMTTVSSALTSEEGSGDTSASGMTEFLPTSSSDETSSLSLSSMPASSDEMTELTSSSSEVSVSSDIMLSDSTSDSSDSDASQSTASDDDTSIKSSSKESLDTSETGSGDATTIEAISDGSESSSGESTTVDSSAETTTGGSTSSGEETTTISADGETTMTPEGTSSTSSDDTSDKSSTSDSTESSETTMDSSSETTMDSSSETTTDSSSETTTDSSSETTTDSSSETTTDSSNETTTESSSESTETSKSSDSSSTTVETIIPDLPDINEADPDSRKATSKSVSVSTDSSDDVTTETSEGSTSGSKETSDVSETTTSSSEKTESSDKTSDSLETDTESTGMTTEGSEVTSGSSEVTSGSSEVSSGSSEMTSGSSEETSESSEVTTVSSEGYASTTPLSTDYTSSSSSTEESSSNVSDLSSVTTESDDVTDSSQSPVEIAITAEQRMKKCKPKKTKKCEKSEFGCCPDERTEAKGPFSEGCPMPETCEETKHGCCADGVSPAEGPKQKGCPPSLCAETLFGCCKDKVTTAEGNDYEGCPVELPVTDKTDELITFYCSTTDSFGTCAYRFGCCPDMILSATGPNNAGCFTCEGSGDCDSCEDTKFGCCPDNSTAATGPNHAGCDDEEGSGAEPLKTCSDSEYGCCPDGKSAATGPNFKDCGVIDHKNCTISYFGCCPNAETPALGPNFDGCSLPCETETHGCCDDGISPAHGPNKEGCCLNSAYGCCPDNILAAHGPNLEGCGCQYSRFGCCPGNSTAARGRNNEGCGCQHTPHGCCPNRYTPAAGPDFQGCPCYTYQFGCCPDGESIAKGPQNQGCGCENSELGCCPDERTPRVADKECGCESSKHGCCPDGTSEARGDNFEGCTNIPVIAGAACTETKDRGSCRDFTVKWFFDMEYGGCSRFWYGGCEGNNNRFKSQDDCKQTCVEPPGRDACHLPKVEGPCEGYYPMWYYDSERKQCGQFIYGGCLGNNNKFQTVEECQGLCVTHGTADACDQPKHEGPCQGNFTRWHFDAETKVCQAFTYGGCKENRNNFLTESSCVQQCLQPGRSRDLCALPREVGKCNERLPKWFFDASENRCMPFYYTGCDGNGNRFDTEEACMGDCPPRVEQDTCTLPALVGECRNYTDRWYYDSFEVRCRQFYYGGCGGNQNNFQTEHECQNRCERGLATPPPRPPPSTDSCFLPDDRGSCSESLAQWFYDSRDGVCKQFLYGGCEGNDNRFASRQECEQHCSNVQDLCNLPVVVGPCSGSQQQYYYDRNTDSCYPFDYGGCQGNANKFDSSEQCEQRCRKSVPSVPSRVGGEREEPPPADICRSPVDPGPCHDDINAWHFDERVGACQAFVFGGCGGNANRFESEEQCERHCGTFVRQDVCSLPSETGPCRAAFRKFYFEQSTGRCREFTYGGCAGNGNRFTTIEECEAVCLHREEPIPSGNHTQEYNQAVCKQSVDQGSCPDGNYKRWFYDEERATCIPFIYSGCAGNMNRFKDFKTCISFCTGVDVPDEVKPDDREEELERERQERERQELERERDRRERERDERERAERERERDRDREPPRVPGPEIRPPPPINEVDVDSQPPKVETDCLSATEDCRNMRCAYGIERYMDTDNCARCRCHDVCKDHVCDEGLKCSIDLYTNPETNNTEYRAVCRPGFKPGVCPSFAPGSSSCVRECNTDADCSGTGKCCQHDCGTSCVTQAPEAYVTQPPPRVDPYGRGVPPRITATEPMVRGEEGNYATLRCLAQGDPTPTISWRKGTISIDGTGGRHKLLLDGSLQIIGLYRSDAGTYICVADNGIAPPAQREVHLDVADAVDKPAEIIGEPNTYVVVTLGVPASLQCYAIGSPRPSVTWWSGDRMLPLTSALFEQRRDFSLLIHSVTLRNLGPYTCQAYNGLGKAASWTITVQSVGPVYSNNPEDFPFTKYLVSVPKRPEIAAPSRPEVERPSYPYRPVRPPPVIEQPTDAPPIVQPSVPGEPPTPRSFIVPVQANITADRTTFAVGSDVSLPCVVDGHPSPRVLWFKNDQRLEPSERIQISESHRLLILRAESSDSGHYRCEAANQYGSSSSLVSISVQGVFIHPNCTDNPFFANCKLIVQAQYCTHKYYARFCCKSCTQAGQLPSHGPHLDRSGTPARK